MEIRELTQETYAGRKFTARYQTYGYYDIRAAEDGFRVEYRPFAAPGDRDRPDGYHHESGGRLRGADAGAGDPVLQ